MISNPKVGGGEKEETGARGSGELVLGGEWEDPSEGSPAKRFVKAP